MPRRPRVDSGGLAYRIQNRGVGGIGLFDDANDCAAVVRVLAEAVTREPGIRLLGCCVMPNPWRLVVWPEAESHGPTAELRAELETFSASCESDSPPYVTLPDSVHGTV
ncbi:MAG: hypothetical protein JJU36_14665 [Phycisphaeraceae bacterium]|nr:hypothetical protein [Phycisphaeraceae bacterium]